MLSYDSALQSANCLSHSCASPAGREREDEVVGVEPNHKTARKSGPLYIVHYSLGRIPLKTNRAGVGVGRGGCDKWSSFCKDDVKVMDFVKFLFTPEVIQM